MAEVRVKETGEIVSLAEFKRRHYTTSFPVPLKPDVLEAFGAEPVLETPKPAPDAKFNGVERDKLGNLIKRWSKKNGKRN